MMVAGATVPLVDARRIYVARTYAYVAAKKDGLVIIDVKHPERPAIYQKVDFGGQMNDAEDVVVGATNASLFAYVADGRNGLKVHQPEPAQLRLLAGKPTSAWARPRRPWPCRRGWIATAPWTRPAADRHLRRLLGRHPPEWLRPVGPAYASRCPRPRDGCPADRSAAAVKARVGAAQPAAAASPARRLSTDPCGLGPSLTGRRDPNARAPDRPELEPIFAARRAAPVQAKVGAGLKSSPGPSECRRRWVRGRP